MKTSRFYLFTMLLISLLYVSPAQVFAYNNDDDNDVNIKEEVRKLRIENERLRQDSTKLEERVKELEKKLNGKDLNKSNNSSQNKNNSQQAQQGVKHDEENNNIPNLLTDVEKMLKLPYSKIDSTTIDSLMKECKKNENAKKYGYKKIQEANKKLNTLKNDLLVYNKAVEAIKSPFNKNNIGTSINKIGELKAKHDEKFNKTNGLNRLHSQLKNYERYNGLFIKLLEEIKGHSDKDKNFKTWLSKKMEEYNINELKKIPFIKKKWDEYENAPNVDKLKIINNLLKEFVTQ